MFVNKTSYHECEALIEEAMLDPIVNNEEAYLIGPVKIINNLLQLLIHGCNDFFSSLNVLVYEVDVLSIFVDVFSLLLCQKVDLFLHAKESSNRSFSD